MKKLCVFAITLCLLAMCIYLLPQDAHAASRSEPWFQLNADGESYTLEEHWSVEDSFVIPATYNGKPVTGIGNYAFYECTNLTSITIPDSITSIGEYAFSDCYSLTSITIPDSVTTIGDCAFADCTSLSSVTIGNGVTTIGTGAFSFCPVLTSVTIPDNVITIGGCAFAECYKLTSVTIGNGVTTIEWSAFVSCTRLSDVTLGKNVSTIGEHAFCYCSALKNVWYAGTVADRESIEIGDKNNNLTDASWHYNVCLHTYSAECDSSCDDCGAIRPTNHSPSEQLSHDQTHHWHICTVCGEIADQAEHDLISDNQCSVCGVLYTPGDLNSDDNINSKDVAYLLRHILFPNSYPVNQEVDYNHDGKVNSKDVAYLLRHILFPNNYPLS